MLTHCQAIADDPDLITVWTGSNDLIAGRDPAVFAAQLGQMLTDLRQRTRATVYVADLPDLTQAPYDIDDCSRIQIGPVSHGRLSLGPISTVPNGGGPGLDVHLLANDVRIDSVYQVAAGSFQLGINGRPDDLNAVLADLVYTPDADYY